MPEVYVKVRPTPVGGETRELVAGEVLADFGPDGELLGVEVLGAASVKIDGHPAMLVVEGPPLMPSPFPEVCG